VRKRIANEEQSQGAANIFVSSVQGKIKLKMGESKQLIMD
jgi:hypothetical protein